MNELHDLKKKVSDQLTEYSHQELSMQNIDVIGKLVDIMKDINEITMHNEGTYNGRNRDSMGRYMNYSNYDNMYRNDMPYNNRMVSDYRNNMM